MHHILHMIVRGFSIGRGTGLRRVAFARAFAPLLVLGGCVEIIPADPEAGKVFGSIEQIEIGETTRDEVLALLGKPRRIDATDFTYAGNQRTASFFIWHPYTVHVPDLSDPWRVRISFDADGVVESVHISEDEDPQISAKTERQILGETESRFMAACHEAHKGRGVARSTVAAHYLNGWSPVAEDRVQALKWFRLAALSGYKPAERYATELAQKMSSTEIAIAEKLVSVWQTDHTECERIVGPD